MVCIYCNGMGCSACGGTGDEQVRQQRQFDDQMRRRSKKSAPVTPSRNNPKKANKKGTSLKNIFIVAGIVLGLIYLLPIIDSTMNEQSQKPSPAKSSQYNTGKNFTTPAQSGLFRYRGDVKNPYKPGEKGHTPHGYGFMDYGEQSYEGYFINGKRHGEGIYKWDDGSYLQGNFVNGEITYGKQVFASGGIYIGEFSDWRRHGKGAYTWKNGNKFTGGWRFGEEHGKGTLTYANGTKKEGYWRDGEYLGAKNEQPDKPDGIYESREINGNVYTGYWKNDNLNGYGTVKYQSRYEYRQYKGHWKEHKFHGEGKLYYKNGQSIKGKWNEGEIIGSVNVYNSENTLLYSGHVEEYDVNPWTKSFVYHGYGETEVDHWDYINSLGKDYPVGEGKSKLKGEWKNGDFVKGTIIRPDGTIYKGDVLHWHSGGPFLSKDGEGTQFLPNGTTYEGQFIYDRKHGQGKLTCPSGKILSGMFHADLFLTQSTQHTKHTKRCRTFFEESKCGVETSLLCND